MSERNTPFENTPPKAVIPNEHAARTEMHLAEINQHHPDTGIVGKESPDKLPSGEEVTERLDKMNIEGVSEEEIKSAIDSLQE